MREQMSYRYIRVEHDGPVSWIVLNRPEKANALSGALLDEFSEALRVLRDRGGPILGIRGEGAGFSSGYDIEEVGMPKGADPVGDRTRLQRNLDRFLEVWDHPKPVIAAVHGYCIAGASQLCIFADLTVVTDDVRIAEPTVPIGGGFIAPLWAPLVGPKRAKEMSFVPGNTIDGRTAVEWGWANHSVAPDHLLRTVRVLAESMALTPPDMLTMKKVSINRAMEAQGLRAAINGVAETDALLHLTPAVLAIRERIQQEGLRAVIDSYRVPRTTDITRGRVVSETDRTV